MNLEQQREYWMNDTIEHAYEWGDPLSKHATQKDGMVLGNYYAIFVNVLPYIMGRNVVEIGCGAGKWTQLLASYAREIIGVDITPQERFSRNEKTSFYQSEGFELWGIDDNRSDFVFSMDALIRTPFCDLKKYVKEFERVLNPNGKMCIHLPCSEQELSRVFGFTPLSSDDIRGMFSRECVLDLDTINHGVLVWI